MARKPEPDEDAPPGPPPADARVVSAAAQAPASEQAAAALTQVQTAQADEAENLTGVALVYRKAADGEPEITVPGFAPRGVTMEEALAKPALEVLGALATGVYRHGPAWADLLDAHPALKAEVAARAKAEAAAQEAQK